LKRYSICIITPPEYPHSEVFNEVAIGLQGGFGELGIKAPILRYPEQQPRKGEIGIFLGANILPAFPKIQLPDNAIIFNLEQLTTDTNGWLNEEYLHLLRTHKVWDYSKDNIALLERHGVQNAQHCGIGYAKTLSRISPAVEDIDVLFYGSIFGRRIPILDAVETTGLRVQKLFGSYGVERDAWIARSKIVLNLHAYPSTTFEVVRCSYLWANRKCIISESSSEIPPSMTEGLLLGHAESIPILCQRAATDANLRISVATVGNERFKDMRQSLFLKKVISP
jgi:hypothetical protein